MMFRPCRFAGQWPVNLGSERDWGFQAEPNPHLNGRTIPLNAGKLLGGGSSINVMIWSRGHQKDWDFFAQQAADPAWSYESVLDLYKRVEDWNGPADPTRRGSGGPLFVQSAPDPNPVALALLDAARAVSLPRFDSPNGQMAEGRGGCSLIDMRVREGRRLSVFRSYTYPYMDKPNFTVLTSALVTRVLFEGHRATGVEIFHDGQVHRFGAGSEVILSLGAIQTPKVLMQSGIGEGEELRRFDISVVADVPGVGAGLQDHAGPASCMWEYLNSLEPRNNGAEATFFWPSHSGLDAPDMQVIQGEIAFASPEATARFSPPPSCWVLWPGLVRPRSTGRVRITGPNPNDPLRIDTGMLEDPEDIKAIIRSVELCREIGNSAPLSSYVKREVMPGPLKGLELENFIRDAVITVWHQASTAKMGHDALSVVDSRLRVQGITNLRIADASIMPRVTTGNTMAPTVVIGERAAEILKADHEI